jgi:hypothetical protein
MVDTQRSRQASFDLKSIFYTFLIVVADAVAKQAKCLTLKKFLKTNLKIEWDDWLITSPVNDKTFFFVTFGVAI